MEIKTYKSETIVIKNPSKELLGLMQKMREHKQSRREMMREKEPMFTINA